MKDQSMTKKQLIEELESLRKRAEKLDKAEEDLRMSEQRFRVAAESLSDLIYEWDMKETIEWFGDIDSWMGYTKGKFPRTLDGWVETLHPEDKERVWAAVENHLKNGVPYKVEYRVRTKNGEWHWWSANKRHSATSQRNDAYSNFAAIKKYPLCEFDEEYNNAHFRLNVTSYGLTEGGLTGQNE
jgi:PAS domain-containing protein